MTSPVFSTRIRPLRTALAVSGLTLATSALAWAEEAATPPPIDTGDTAWVLTASALVLMMTLPGLALFYGGLVRTKNVLNVLMQCVLSAGIVGVLWILVGYSLAFSTGNAWIGDFSKVGLSGITLESVTANFATPPRNIPEYVFVMFQAMFAIITPALILGAIAERMRFDVWCAFIATWLLAVYCPIAHMVWGSEGWIFKSGAIDFAGGLVVHMSSGFSAIAAATLLGHRRGFGKDAMPPHSLPLCLIGAGLLWTGSDSMPAARSARARSPRSPSPTPAPRRRRRWSRGRWSSGCTAASRRRSAARPPRLRASLPSRPRAGTSPRSARSRSASA